MYSNKITQPPYRLHQNEGSGRNKCSRTYDDAHCK